MLTVEQKRFRRQISQNWLDRFNKNTETKTLVKTFFCSEEGQVKFISLLNLLHDYSESTTPWIMLQNPPWIKLQNRKILTIINKFFHFHSEHFSKYRHILKVYVILLIFSCWKCMSTFAEKFQLTL